MINTKIKHAFIWQIYLILFNVPPFFLNVFIVMFYVWISSCLCSWSACITKISEIHCLERGKRWVLDRGDKHKVSYFPVSNGISRKWHLCPQLSKGLSLWQENQRGKTCSSEAGVPPRSLRGELDFLCQQYRSTLDRKQGISECRFLWWVYLCGAQRNLRKSHCLPEWSLLSSKLPDVWEASWWSLCPGGIWWVAHRGRPVSSAGNGTVRRISQSDAHSRERMSVT